MVEQFFWTSLHMALRILVGNHVNLGARVSVVQENFVKRVNDFVSKDAN